MAVVGAVGPIGWSVHGLTAEHETEGRGGLSMMLVRRLWASSHSAEQVCPAHAALASRDR